MNDNLENNKSIEELAREAMDAIKKSEINNKNKEDREFREEHIKRERALQEEVKRKIKKKLILLKKKEDNTPKAVDDGRFLVSWENKDKRGLKYDGHFNDILTFQIKKGINLYHLYVKDNNLNIENWENSTCTSIDLYTLKKRADKMLKKSISKK